MTPRGRRTTKAVLLVLAGLISVVFGATAVDAARELAASTDRSARQTLLVGLAAEVLKGLGLVVVLASQVIGFRDWPTLLRPFAPLAGSPRGRGGLRRARRQIDGEEPYEADELPRLRAIAKHRLSLGHVATATRIGSVGLIMLSLGIALDPPFATGVGHVLFRVLGLVLLAAIVASLAVRPPLPDARAQAFLDRSTRG